MFLSLIIAVLGVIACYCAGAWLWLAYSHWRVIAQLRAGTIPAGRLLSYGDVATHTFRLGVCLVLALGFLGVVLS